MKPEFMRLRRALAGTFVAILIAAGVVVLSPAASASAHHNKISVSASCVDFVWMINWKIVNSEHDKWEEITDSSDPSIIAVGTKIAPKGVFTKSETVADKTTKTLSIKAEWSNGVKSADSKTIYPADFPGVCERPHVPSTPDIELSVQPCVTGGALGAVSLTLGKLDIGSQYLAKLHSSTGAVLETLSHTASAATAVLHFTARGAGTYFATVSTDKGTLLATSATAVITQCKPDTPTLIVVLEPCPPTGGTPSAREITVRLAGLSPLVAYTVRLLDADPGAPVPVVATVTTPGGNDTTFEHTFINVPSPGDYRVEVSAGAVKVTSDKVAAPMCDLDTLPPPSIEAFVDRCSPSNAKTNDSLSVRLSDLDATKTYYVRIVDASGTIAAGGADKLVSGVTATTVAFPALTTPGRYTAQLLVDPGKQLAATDPNAVRINVCLPTLASTGPGALFPLGGVAALLLTLGGAIVTGRLRRQASL